MERKPETTYVGKIVKDFNREAEKKAQKRENTYLSYIIKAIARDQDKNIAISKLQKDLKNSLETITLLQMQNDIKEGLLHLKEKQLDSLKEENKRLLLMLKQEQGKSTCLGKDKKPSIKIRKNINNNLNYDETVSTSVKNNLIKPPTNKTLIKSNGVLFNTISRRPLNTSPSRAVVSTSTDPLSGSTIIMDVKKRSIQIVKDTNAPNVTYNLRKRSKV